MQAERDFVMQKLFEAAEIPDADIRESAMQCLVELARLQYEEIQFHFDKIAIITSKAATGDEQKVGAQGIEFWTSLCAEEIDRKKRGIYCKDYIAGCKDDLIKLLLTGVSNV